MEKGEDQNK